MALSEWDIEKELAKNIVSSTSNKVNRALSSISSPPQQVARNIYSTENTNKQNNIPIQLNNVSTQVSNDVKQEPIKTSFSSNENIRPNSLATIEDNKNLNDDRFLVKLNNGINFHGANEKGQRLYTQTTQDGQQARMLVSPARGNTAYSNRVLNNLKQTPYDFEGSAEDQARFNAPMKATIMNGPGLPSDPNNNSLTDSHNTWLQHSGQAQNSGMQPPKYLSREEGAALGLGWKGRLAKYKEDVDTYNRLTGNQTALDIESMREAGAGRRAYLAALSDNAKTDLDRQRLGLAQQKFYGEQEGQELDNQLKQSELIGRSEINTLKASLGKLTPGTPEYNNTERRLGIALGKLGEQKQPNVQMIEELRDPNDPTSGNVKRPIRINEDGTYTRMPERQTVDAMSIIKRDPQHMAAYENASPEDKARIIKQINAQLSNMAGK